MYSPPRTHTRCVRGLYHAVQGMEVNAMDTMRIQYMDNTVCKVYRTWPLGQTYRTRFSS